MPTLENVNGLSNNITLGTIKLKFLFNSLQFKDFVFWVDNKNFDKRAITLVLIDNFTNPRTNFCIALISLF